MPQRIQMDNESEFISKELDRWAYEHGVVMDHNRPGTPTDNPFIESFNGNFRDECLNTHWLLSLEYAAGKMEVWRCDYNGYRPHSSLDRMTPDEFIADHLAKGDQEEVKCLLVAPSPRPKSSSTDELSPAGSSEDLSPDKGIKKADFNSGSSSLDPS